MTRSTGVNILRVAIVPITLLLFGCPRGGNPCTDINAVLQGDLQCGRLEIPAGQTRTFRGQVTVTSQTIVLNGTLSGDDGTQARKDGSSFRLDCDGGSIDIGGRIEAGDGFDQNRAAAGGPLVIGDPGGNGGDLTITNCATLNIRATGRLQAGTGGRGQNATARGSTNAVNATSGRGGRGGDISILSVRRSVIVGDLQAGSARTSGDASATGVPDPGTERFPIRVEAEGTEGPRGGNIRLRLTDPQASIFISRFGEGQQPLRDEIPRVIAGNGGPGGLASATGGERAAATSRNAGNGGDVTVELCDTCGFNFRNPTTVPGNGARTALPRQDAATATAFSDATASAGNGGDGGRVLVFGTLTVEGRGGESGTARAQTADGSCRLQRGTDPMGARKGGGSTAAAVGTQQGDQCAGN